MKEKNMIWTVSNMLSFFRLLLSIPVGYAMWYEKPWIVLAIGILAIITDLLDGYIARKMNQVSEAGKVIDPLADKIFIGTIGLILVIKGWMPLWLGLTIIIRDILIMLGGIYATRKLKYVLPSNLVGKITVDLVTILFVAMIFRLEWIVVYWQWLVVAGLVYSFIQYGVRMFKLFKEK